MSGAAPPRRGSSSPAASCSRRSYPGSSSTGRRGCRAGAGRHRFSPTVSCGGCGARAPSSRRAPAAVYRFAPAVAAASLARRHPARPCRLPGARPRRGTRLPRPGRAPRACALRPRGRLVGRLERLLADGREPRPDDRRFVDATLVLAVAVAALVAGTTNLLGDLAGTAGTGVWSSPALALGAIAFALVVARRDRPAADRQPRHASRADDDPRGPAARVRRP